MTIDLQSLGFSQEELQARVVDQLCERLMGSQEFEPNVRDLMRTVVKERIDEKVRSIMAETVLPRLDEFINTLTLQETNKWGEKKGEPKTFVEYLTERSNAYWAEEVDSNGFSQEECRRKQRSWYTAKQTRLVYQIDCFLHNSIKTAMANALSCINETLSETLAQTAKKKLQELAKTLKVSIKTG